MTPIEQVVCNVGEEYDRLSTRFAPLRDRFAIARWD